MPLNHSQPLAFQQGGGWRHGAVFWCKVGLPQLQEIVGSPFAFAAIRADGAVVTWGTPNRGGDSSAVAVPMAALGGDGLDPMFFTCSGKTSGPLEGGAFPSC